MWSLFGYANDFGFYHASKGQPPSGLKDVVMYTNVCAHTHAFALGSTETDLYFGKITLTAVGRTG